MKKRLTCTGCNEAYDIDLEKYGGKKIKCKKCQAVISVPTAAELSDEFDVVEEPISTQNVPPKTASTDVLSRERLPSQRGAVNIALLQRKEESREQVCAAFFQVYGREEDRVLATASRQRHNKLREIDGVLKGLRGKSQLLTADKTDAETYTRELDAAKELLSNEPRPEGTGGPKYEGLSVPKSEDFTNALTELGKTVYEKWAHAEVMAESENAVTSVNASDGSTLESRITQVFTSLIPNAGKLYKAPNIPQAKLDGALSAFASPKSDEKILCLIDNTLFGSAKEGCIVTTKGIYWRKPFGQAEHSSYCGLFADQIASKKKDVRLNPTTTLAFPLLDESAVLAFAEFLRQATLLSRAMPAGHLTSPGTPPDSPEPAIASTVPSTVAREAWRDRDYRAEFPDLCDKIDMLRKQIEGMGIAQVPKSAGGWIAAVLTYGASTAVSGALEKNRLQAALKDLYSELGKEIYAKYGATAGPKGLVRALAKLYDCQSRCQEVINQAASKIAARIQELNESRAAAEEEFEKIQLQLAERIAEASEQVRKGDYQNAQTSLLYLVKAVPSSNVGEVLVLMSQVSYSSGNAADAAHAIQDAISRWRESWI